MRLPLLSFALAAVVTVNGLDCGDGLVRGVNLGGLFLLEPWITPSIFEDANALLGVVDQVVDEYTYALYMDPAEAATRLDAHWDNFYSEADLQELADSGITHIRIPIGYWLVDVLPEEPFPDPPATDNDGQRKYLKRVLGWAENIGLKVLIDLHGAPESQNGFDNSGKRGPISWLEGDGDHTNVDRTLTILVKITDLMNSWINDGTISRETFWGIEFLNEPWGITELIWDELRDNFYFDAYDLLRPRLPESDVNKLVIQQAFRSPQDFIGYMPEPAYTGVGLDLHNYLAFGEFFNGIAEVPEEGWPQSLSIACDYVSETSVQTLDVYVGEWSLAVTDCQEYLDGGYATPYVPPNGADSTCAYYNSDFSTFTDEYKDFLKNYIRAQMDAYEAGQGWFFWTAKTENNCAPEWDYLFLLQNGIAPDDLCNRTTYCN